MKIGVKLLIFATLLAFDHYTNAFLHHKTLHATPIARPLHAVRLNDEQQSFSANEVSPVSPPRNIFNVINAVSAVFLAFGLTFAVGGENPFYGMSVNGKSFPVMGSESIMSTKAHGTSGQPVQGNLRWHVDGNLADRITNYNRHFAETSGYWIRGSSFLQEEDGSKPVNFYDSVTGALLFTAPKDRSFEDFKEESLLHGWPSFRDQEVNWKEVRSLKNGEMVSLTGTHLGHNIPDLNGNRYCINLVSIAGQPPISTNNNNGLETVTTSNIATAAP